MTDLTPEQAIEQLKKLPEDKQRLVLGKLTPDARKGILTKLTGPDAFSANPNSEGLYRMMPSSVQGGTDTSQEVKVPYSKVRDAQKAGYNLHPDEEPRYDKDRTHEGKAPSWLGGMSDRIQKFLQPTPNEGPISSSGVSNTDKAAARTIMAAPGFLKDLATAFVNVPHDQGRSLMDLVDPGNVPLGLQHQFQADMKVDPKMAVQNLIGTLVGMGLVGKTMHGAGEAVKGEAKAVPSAARGMAEAITGTGPRQIKGMAEKTEAINTEAAGKAAEKNAANAEEHKEKTQESLHATAGAELLHEAQQRAEKAKADAANAKAAREHLQATIDALHATKGSEIGHEVSTHAENELKRAKHAEDVAKVREHNARVTAKHQAEVQKIKEENDAAARTLELRRDAEQKLEQETKEYYAKEDAAKKQAKQAENEAWKPWRDKTKDVTVDGDEIVAPLKKITDLSPEANRMIHQLVPDGPVDGEDEVPSLYANERTYAIKALGLEGNYWSLPEQARANVDSVVSSSGIQPEPRDLQPPLDTSFDPESGKPISLERVHRAKSILGRNIADGRYEGPLLGEMKQVARVLDEVERSASEKAGAGEDLRAARKATAEYQKAFGKERPPQRTVDEIRKKGANPEQYRADTDQERLDAASVHSPELVEAYKRVKEARENLKKMPKEESLRKSIQQIPPPPTVGDLRSEYELKPEPEPPELAVLQPPNRVEVPDRPEEVQPKEVAPPERAPQPDRPEEIIPERKTISPEDIHAARKEKAKATGENLRAHGVRRAFNALLYTAPSAVISTFLGHPGIALAEAATSPFILAGSQALANLLERPDVVNWIAKITPKDAAMFDQLPTEQKALFTENLNNLVEAAKKKGMPVSNALTAYIAAQAGAKKASLSELKEEAKKRNPKSVKVTAPDGSIHVFPNEDAASAFKKEVGIL